MTSRKPSLFYTLLHAKCPRCREGNLFPPGPWYSRKFADMYPKCPCCGQTYEPEPGFYYGAMYVSFGFNTGIFLAVLVVLNFVVDEITLAMVVGMVLAIVVGLLPVTYRLSRALWINIFVRYEGPCQAIPKL
jgi:hypothetical protein